MNSQGSQSGQTSDQGNPSGCLESCEVDMTAKLLLDRGGRG